MRIIIFLFLLPLFTYSQEMNGDTLITKAGLKVWPDQMLKMGVGSTPDGSFKFIRISSTSVFQHMTRTGRNDLVNQANGLYRSSAGLQYKVVRIDKRGTKKRGFVFYPIINIGMTRYEIDIENAITVGELEVPNEFKPKKGTSTFVVKQEISVADELKKLKQLLNDSIITKEEFDAQKKKLLEKN